MVTRGRALVGLMVLGAAGCPLTPEPEPAPAPEVQDVPFEGTAFPNLRAKLHLASGGAALTTDALADRLIAVDVESGARVADVPIGRDPVSVDGPVGIAVDRARDAVYVALAHPPLYEGAHGEHEGHLEVPGTVQKLALDDLRIVGEQPVDVEPSAVALSADGASLVVSHFLEQGLASALEQPDDLEFSRARIALLDPARFEEVPPPEPVKVRVCVGAKGLSLERPAAGRAFVACYGEDALAIVDLLAAARGDARDPVTRISLGPQAGPPGSPFYGPVAAVLSTSGAEVAVPCADSRELRFVSTSSADLARPPVPTEGVPGVPAYAGSDRRLWVVERQPDAVALLDVALGETILRRPLDPRECASPRQVARADANRLLILCAGDGVAGSVLVVDASDFATVAVAALGASPSAISELASERGVPARASTP